MTKEQEAELIEALAHFNKEIPLAFEKELISTGDIPQDERDNAVIEMYKELKEAGRLKYRHE